MSSSERGERCLRGPERGLVVFLMEGNSLRATWLPDKATNQIFTKAIHLCQQRHTKAAEQQLQQSIVWTAMGLCGTAVHGAGHMYCSSCSAHLAVTHRQACLWSGNAVTAAAAGIIWTCCNRSAPLAPLPGACMPGCEAVFGHQSDLW